MKVKKTKTPKTPKMSKPIIIVNYYQDKVPKKYLYDKNPTKLIDETDKWGLYINELALEFRQSEFRFEAALMVAVGLLHERLQLLEYKERGDSKKRKYWESDALKFSKSIWNVIQRSEKKSKSKR